MTNRSVQTVRHIGVGIDTARYGHRVTFLQPDRQPAAPPLTVIENAQGYQQLSNRLQQLHRKFSNAQLHVHLDAAGQYARNLEQHIRSLDLPIIFSIGEPKRNKDYHRAFSPKKKTDNTESLAMARFGVVEQPQATPEVPHEFFALREIASRMQGLIRDTTRAINRLHNVLARVFPELAALVGTLDTGYVLQLLKKYPTPQRIAAARLRTLQKIPHLKDQLAEKIQDAAKTSVGSLRAEVAEAIVIECADQVEHCQKSKKRLEKLLLQAYRALPPSPHIHVPTIVGIGEITAAVLVSKIISIDRFASPENLVGYFGFFPEENTSGVDRKGNKIPPGSMQMSAKGCDLVRYYLWNAAKSAIQHNAAVRELYARLRAKGTRGDVALGHCCRKLLHQVFGIWSSNTPFDEERARSRHHARNPKGTEPPKDSPGSPAETKTAAGHKRDVLPKRKVVTAATSSVAPSKKPVNEAPDTRRARSVDFAHLRAQIKIEQVLSYLGYWDGLRGSGDERRGRCPLHESHGKGYGKGHRDFAVNVQKNVFHCVHPDCDQGGNVLDLWAAVHGLPLQQAALHLAETFQLQIQPRTEKRSP